MAEETFNDGYWNPAGIIFWSCPKSVTGYDGPTQQCIKHTDPVAMTLVRIYHWHPAAYHAYGGGAWTGLRDLLEEGEAVDKYCDV
eukprot:4713951-Pyramimonas_sp.AAC.1